MVSGNSVKRALEIGQWTVIVVVLAAALLYAGDYLILRYRVHAGSAFGVVHIEPAYAVPHKDGRAEVFFGDTETDKCVRYSACWYLARQNGRTVVLSLLPKARIP
jgi:hypothetical protein